MSSAASAVDLYLSRLCLRSALTDVEKVAVRSLVEAGELVVAEGDFVYPGMNAQHACLIVEGLVSRFAQLRDGSRHIVAFHIPGDMADLHSVVAKPVTWALRAMTPSTILRIPHSALIDASTRFPALAIAFWRDCIVDSTILAQWAVNIARKDALPRVAHLLCEMSLRYRVSGASSGDPYPFPITQGDMADALGLTPIHLNRMLQRLKELGLASKLRGTVTIHDWRQMKALAEFDADYLQLEQANVR